ncbi:hypothetical protein ACFL0H_09045 [Thermodesulfobacteriota bacterium]
MSLCHGKRTVRDKGTCVPVFFILVYLLIHGCSTDRIVMDLANYINLDILRISEMEVEPLKRYAELTGPNYVSRDVMLRVLKEDVIPVYRRFFELLKEIKPQTDEIKKLHRVYINGAELIYRGLREKLGGLELKDEDMIRAANKKIERGRIENERWRKELSAIYVKHGISENPG